MAKKPKAPTVKRTRSTKDLLAEHGRKLAHLHALMHQIDAKLDVLLARASGADQATIDGLTDKQKTANDALEAAIQAATPSG